LSCSKETTGTQQSNSNSQNVNTQTNPVADSTTTATNNKDSIVEGTVAEELDQVVREVSGRELNKSLSDFISIVVRRSRPATTLCKNESDAGRLCYQGTLQKRKKQLRNISALRAEISIEANGDGSKARIASPLNGTFIKFYNDLSLQKSGVVLKKGSVLKREANGWVAVKDKETEKRLDDNDGEGTRPIQINVSH